MKKAVCLGCWITVMFMLFGCGARDITQNDITISKDMEAARGKCYDAVSAQASADTLMIKSIKPEDRTMVAMVYLNNKHTTTLVSAITGHTIDKCSGTNLWDFMVAETEAKNKALTAGLGHAITGVKWLAGAWAATDIISNVGATNSVEGQFNSLGVTSQTKSGNTATSNKESYNTATETFEQSGGSIAD